VAALGDLLSRLDADPLRRGKQFERICQWFLTHDPRYTHLRHVWLWDEWPGLWGADAGIDLVAEDHEGHLWAIQAKAYDPAYWVTKHDVDTFLSESGRPQFSFRLLIATTDRIGHNAKRTLAAQEKHASFLGLSGLEAAEINWPSSPADLRAPRLPPKRPWPHVRQAITKVIKGFEGAERGQLIMACGTGKTLAALFIHERLAAKRTLVLVPSLSLLAQTLREWRANKRVEFDFLPVCSDDTVTDSDAVVAHTSDLGLPATTDPERIAEFLRRRSGPRVVFATYQSSPEIAIAFRLGRVPAFDLVIADEAHRCAARVSSDFATVLDSEAIKARRRLFMTATPRYFTGRVVREAKEADFEVASMDNEAVFGPVFHRLGFSEAIERNLLTDYRVVVVGVDDTTYRDWARRGRFVTADCAKVTDARALAGQIGLAKAMRRYDLRRMITFHSRIKRARDFACELPEVIAWMPPRQRPKGTLWCDHVSGEMAAGQRHVLLRHLGSLDLSDRGLLSNARCLTEGIDVPTLDGVAFIDPRASEIDIIQAVGRAIRRAPDKTVGTIVIPVFVETEEDPITALDDSAFKPVWDVTKALRSHDEELGRALDELRRELGRTGRGANRPSKIHFDVPERVSASFVRAFDVRLVKETTVAWEFWFGLLQAFADRNGHAGVPSDLRVDGHRLGFWAAEQRHLYRKSELSVDRIRLLTGLPGWSWDPRDDQWDVTFNELEKYIRSHGHTSISTTYATETGVRLQVWVTAQRRLYASGKLDVSRQRRLEALPGWAWEPATAKWEIGFAHLRDYADAHGTAAVPKGHVTADGYRLSQWVSVQRSFYATGRLEQDRLRQIEALPGWTWNTRIDQWEIGYAKLTEYIKLPGSTPIKDIKGTDKFDGYPIGQWVKVQRRFHSKGELSADRQRRLQALPGWSWNIRSARWEEGFGVLLHYVDIYGDALVPTSHAMDDFDLGAWVSTQRSFYRKGVLSSDRARRLEQLPGWAWDARRGRR
jgi:superfamily II DNA or RNA helicase